MRVVVQRVSQASVKVNEKEVGKIALGFMLLVGFCISDNEDNARNMAKKVANLRIFEDENQKINLGLKDVSGEILSISQFTLYADTKKGNRPSFVNAQKGELALGLYELFNDELRKHDLKVETGIFGEDMTIDSKNIGPVTIILEN